MAPTPTLLPHRSSLAGAPAITAGRGRARRGIRHLTTQPYRPRTNGKVERFHKTMAREWAYGLAYKSHRHRNAALPHWLNNYNRQRPHSSIGDRPPISRVHNVRG